MARARRAEAGATLGHMRDEERGENGAENQCGPRLTTTSTHRVCRAALACAPRERAAVTARPNASATTLHSVFRLCALREVALVGGCLLSCPQQQDPVGWHSPRVLGHRVLGCQAGCPQLDGVGPRVPLGRLVQGLHTEVRPHSHNAIEAPVQINGGGEVVVAGAVVGKAMG